MTHRSLQSGGRSAGVHYPIGTTPHASPFRENLRSIAGISACNLLLLINDMLMKLVSTDLPLGEMMFLRGCFTTVELGLIVVFTGVRVHPGTLINRAVIWRTIGEIASAYLYLVALFQMPIGNVNTINQVVPLMVAAGAAVFFKEPVGWRRWLAIGAGFVGVLIVIRPGFNGFNVFSLLALGSAAFVALRDMTTRVMPHGLPTLLITFVTAFAVTISGLGYGVIISEQWVIPSGHAIALLFAASIFLMGSYLTAVDFMRHGDIAVVAPFRYTAIIWAVLLGFLVWGEVPDTPMLVGMLVIIATGVYTFHRERLIAVHAAAASAEGERSRPLA